jgi:hypothetical protein
MVRACLCAAMVLASAGAAAAGGGAVVPCAAVGSDPLCVEPGRYRATEETVVDLRAGGRVWQRHATERLPHPEARRYCAGLTLQGQGGFRLPSPEELSSLRYKPGGLFGGGSSRHYCIPSIDQVAFPETPAAEFWTARVMADGTAWYVGFDDGRSHRDVQSDPLWVRCVRDGG